MTHWMRRKSKLVKLKGGKCQDCGGVFPDCCFDFDHRDPFSKNFTIGELMQIVSLDTLKKEIELCDLVCANCHRIRGQTNRALLAKKQLAVQMSDIPGLNSRASERKAMVAAIGIRSQILSAGRA